MLVHTIVLSYFTQMERTSCFEPSFFSFIYVDLDWKLKFNLIDDSVDNFFTTYACCFEQVFPNSNPFFVASNAQVVSLTQRIEMASEMEIRCRFFDWFRGFLSFLLKFYFYKLKNLDADC